MTRYTPILHSSGNISLFPRPIERLFWVGNVRLFEKRRIAPEPCTVVVDRVIHIFVAHIKGFQNHIWFMGIGVEVQVES